MSERVVIGIDVGTRSTKGVLIDMRTGRVIAHTSVDHGIELGADGRVEHDADAVWWAESRTVLNELTQRAEPSNEIAAVGLSSCGPCLVGIGATDAALRPGILYGIDTRATAEVADLVGEWPDEIATRRFGMPFSSQSVVPKIRWLEAHEPEVATATTGWLTANGYLALRLTGARVIDHHQAAYFAPDYADGMWLPSADSRVPRLAWSDDVIGEVTIDAADATGVPAGTPVVIGSSDGATDPVGAGVTAGTTALLRYGSTLGLTIMVEGTRPGVAGLWRTPGNRPDQSMYVGGLSTAGSITSWFREQLARDLPSGDSHQVQQAHRQLTSEAAASPIGASGVLTLPYFAGERTPFSDPEARGVIAGVGLDTSRGDLYRSILEGAGFGLRHLVETARAGGVRIDRFRAVGGGSAGSLWPKIVSDVTGIPQDIVHPHLGAPLGAARLAAEGVGLVATDSPAWVTVSRSIEPDAAASLGYDRLYPLFRRLYDGTRDVISELREGRQ